MNGCATDPSQRTALGRDCDALMRMNHSSTVPRHVLGPNGNVLTLSDLPASTRNRWVVRRKAEVVAAIRGGLLSLEEACRRYTLTIDEFRAWERCSQVAVRIGPHGAGGPARMLALRDAIGCLLLPRASGESGISSF